MLVLVQCLCLTLILTTLGGGSARNPVAADLAAEGAGEPVDGAADVSHLLGGRQTLDVPAVPSHPAGQRHEHQQGSWTESHLSQWVINRQQLGL